MATKKCGNTAVLQRKRVKESEGGDSGCEEEEKDGRKERKGVGRRSVAERTFKACLALEGAAKV